VGLRIANPSATGNAVQGNFIGTDEQGMQTAGIQIRGIVLSSVGAGNLVGGVATGEGNLIAGHDAAALELFAGESSSVFGNIIGLAADGVTPLGNGGGILIQASTNNVIGTTPTQVPDGRGNVISGNDGNGISLVQGASADNWIAGNLIGPAASGEALVGNEGHGIFIAEASGTRIGGTRVADRNVIAGSGGHGIVVSGALSQGNFIFRNAIHSNAGLGINLGTDAVTPNDGLGDADVGANGLQNFPVILEADLSGDPARFSGTLESAPSEAFNIEVYLSEEADPSGHGEGQHFVALAQMTTDAMGFASWEVTTAEPLPPGIYATATATGPGSNTSEFSAWINVMGRDPSVGDVVQAILGLRPKIAALDVNGDAEVDCADVVTLINPDMN
jgi:hypothetical protein